MHNSQEIANTIKNYAKSKKITVGTMLSNCNLSKNTLSSMQSGGYLPRAETLIKIADYLGCSVDYLLGRTESPTLDNTQTAGSSINEMEAQVILEYRKSDDMTKEMVHRVLHISVKRENQNLAL